MREARTCLQKYEWKEVKLVSLLRNITTNKSLRVLRSTEKKCHRGTTNAPLTSSRKLINGKVHVTSPFFPCKARADQMRIFENDNTKRTTRERIYSKLTSSLASLSALALVHPPVSRRPFRTPSPRIGRRRRRFRPWTRFLSARRLLSKKKKQIASTWRRA